MHVASFSFERRGVDHFVNERQLEVIRLRKGGRTFNEISKKMDIGTERARQIYVKGLENLRLERDIREYHRELFNAAEDMGMDSATLISFYKRLKKNNIEYAWKKLSDDELRSYPQVGEKFVEFIHEAKKYTPL